MDQKVTQVPEEPSDPSLEESIVARSWAAPTIDRGTLEDLLKTTGDFLDDDGILPLDSP
jgi:hypothetical protein